MKPSILGMLFLLIPLLLPRASAGELTSRPDPEGVATEVRIQLVLLDLQNISDAEQSFTANFTWAARWQDARLAHEGPGAKTVSLDEIWSPRLQIINQQRLQKTFPEKAQVIRMAKSVRCGGFGGSSPNR
jgi:hypothetical protein